MALQPVQLIDLDEDHSLIQQIAQLHHDCILKDGVMMTFMPPLDMGKLITDWRAFARESQTGDRLFFVQMAKLQDGTEELAGIVTLKLRISETGAMRASVSRLLVSHNHRFKGVARMLMHNLEAEAKARNRWMLLLDTTIGSGAEYVYPKLGYKELGRIPDYGFSPKDGKLREEVFYYKDIRDPGEVPEIKIP